jgi:hypothetical protein
LGDHWRSLKPTYQWINKDYKLNFTKILLKSTLSRTHSNKKQKDDAYNIYNSISIVDFENNEIDGSTIKKDYLVVV